MYRDLLNNFTGGIASPDVLARLDMDKYRTFLKDCVNGTVKPYGSIYKRMGTTNKGTTAKNHKARIIAFSQPTTDYMLEFTDYYLTVRYKGEKVRELEAPFSEANIKKLKFIKSADTMFLVCGDLPIYQLKKDGEEWSFEELNIKIPPFGELVDNTSSVQKYTAPGNYIFKAKETGLHTVTVAGGGGGGSGVARKASDKQSSGGNGGRGGLQTFEIELTKDESFDIIVGAGGKGSPVHYGAGYGSPGGDGSDSIAFGYTAKGGGGATAAYSADRGAKNGSDGTSYGYGGEGGTKGVAYSDAALNGSDGSDGWVIITYNYDEQTVLYPSGTSGIITLTSNQPFFEENMVGDSIKLYQEIATKTAVNSSGGEGTGSALFVGDSWSLRTSGIWSGTVTLMRSKDNVEYIDYATYVSNNDDYNASDSGSVDREDAYYFKVKFAITSGTCTVTLTSFSYTAEGIIKLTEITSDTEAIGTLIRSLGSTDSIDEFALSEFSSTKKYPSCIEFFQDRMVLANTDSKPNGLWLSKSSDYTNFDEQIEDGTLTDDSAINTSVIARNDYAIKNLITFQDLCIFTGEDERIISGSSVVTPAQISINTQTGWGSSEAHIPFVADNRVLYIQSNEAYIRDFSYNYAMDRYDGTELTLMVHHLLNGKKIADYTYTKYPDSLIYLILDDGSMLCLTYMLQEKVFGWTRFSTQGNYIAVETIKEDDTDVIYFVVERDGTYYIERQELDQYTEDPADYCMMDNAEIFENNDGSNIVIERFAGKTVWVMTSGDIFNVKEQVVANDGKIEIEPPLSGVYSKIIVGLGYEFSMTIPETHTTIQKTGSIVDQSRCLNSTVVRYYLSYSGYAYSRSKDRAVPLISTLDNGGKSQLDENFGIKLLSGTQTVTLDQNSARADELTIFSEEPYPLRIMFVARDVDVNIR